MYFEGRLRRKLTFLEVWSCNSAEVLGESCVSDALSKLRFLEIWSCNSAEVLGESCVFDVLAVCSSTEASAVIRRKPCSDVCQILGFSECGAVSRRKLVAKAELLKLWPSVNRRKPYVKAVF